MTHGETDISLRMPTVLVEKLDTIAKTKYLNRADVIIDACAYYCQYHDMNSERFPETTRNILFDLARHDEEFKRTLRAALRETPSDNSDTPG
jgi:metal-responsive CopG/Arc/MetJ family transcriptional regulator